MLKREFWKRDWIGLILIPLLLFGVSIFAIYSLFTGEYTQFVQSIESQYLGYIEFIRENFPNILWNPFWYMGFPFYLVYQPNLPFILSFLNLITGIPPSALYRGSIGFFYALGSVSCYFLARELTKKNFSAFLAGVIYAFLPQAAYLVSSIASQGESFSFLPWRLIVLIYYGEGAHIWGLAVVPLALIFFRRLLKNPTRLSFLLTVITSAFILLTSSTAFIPLLLLGAINLAFETMKGKAGEKLKVSFWVLIFTLGSSLFWYNPSFVSAALDFAREGGIFRGIYASPVVATFVIIPTVGVFFLFAREVLKRYRQFRTLALTGTWFIIFFLVVYLRFKDISLLPLPFDYLSRFGPEIELTFPLFLASAVAFIEKSSFWQKSVKVGVWVGTLLLLSFFLFLKLEDFWSLTRPHGNIFATSEYKVAKWLEENADGGSVFVSGTHSQWLNVWTKVFQLRGVKGGDFGGINPWWAHITHQLLKGESSSLARGWLQALGIKYVVVNSQNSKAYFKDFIYPQKFNSFERVFEYEGDAVYKVPGSQEGLALVLPTDWTDSIQIPTDLSSGKVVLDRKMLSNYLSQLNKAKVASIIYSEVNWSKIKVSKEPQESELLLRISYHPGWEAFENGRELKILPDPIGFMRVLGAEKEAVLIFSPTRDVTLSYFISLLTIGFLLFVLLKEGSFNRLVS